MLDISALQSPRLDIGALQSGIFQRGNIDYDQIRSSVRQGAGAKFQMFGGSTATAGNVLIYDAAGNASDGGTAPGTVSSVGLVAPVEFTVTGSPVTGSGVLTLTKATQAANVVYAGPATGAAAAPIFRALAAADLPAASSISVNGTLIGLATNAPLTVNGHAIS